LKKLNFLVIAYYFPPIQSIGVVRTWNLTQELAKKTDLVGTIDVLTTRNADIFPQESRGDAPPSMRIQKMPTFDYRTALSWKSWIFSSNQTKFHANESEKESFLARFFVRFVRTFPFNLLIGEGGFLFIISAFFKSLKLIKQNNIRIIYSSYPTYSDHFVAFLLKKYFKSKIIWVADFRDPHLDPLYRMYYFERVQIWCNRKIISRADIVTTVSDGIAEQLKPFKSSIYTIKSGISNLKFNNLPENAYPPVSDEKKHFFITYTGSMFGNERNPSLLLQAVKTLLEERKILSDEIKIVYAGKDENIWKKYLTEYNLENIFINHGMLSSDEAKQIQDKSHLNLLLSSVTPEIKGILTGKFYEYLATRKPIIVLLNAVGHARDPEFENIIADTGGGLVAYSDSEKSVIELKEFILHYHQIWKQTGDVPKIIPIEKLHQFTWEHQTNLFLNLIENHSKDIKN
jgi:hypothetical protein